jgi:STE24 endopeptidase
MNIYAIIILVTLLADYILNLVADRLNIRALRNDLPDEFKDDFDDKQYQKAQDYTRVRTRFGMITSTFNLVLVLGFWFSGGFNWLDQIVRSWNLSTLVTGLVYIALLMIARTLLSLPFELYSTFVIEERFGFNRTTLKTFVADHLKGFALAVLLGGPVLAGVLAFFQYAGSLAWLYCWIVTTIFTLFIQFIAPRWIMPLFNKFNPIEEGELKERILNYADSVDFSLQGVYIMDGSRRSSKSNAFFTGFGRNKRIALFDTLVNKHTPTELVTVLAHEIGHYKKKHIIKGMVMSIAHSGVLFYLLSIFITHQGLFDAFYMDQMSIYAGLIFFGMLYAPIELILSILMGLLSRKHEYEADRFAVETTKAPETFIKTLKRLSVDNLSNLTPHPFYVFLNYSHPPVLERIRHIRKVAT